MSLSPGTQFGPYEIRGAIGAGGMGEVYLAHDNKLQRDVALKILPRDVAADADRVRRFETEARSASALNHPAIVSIYDLGQHDGQLFISMELVKGQTFRELIASGPLPARRTLHLAAQVADGLAKAHDAGIVHRDLKPDNLMVTEDGFAKILDFGLAKLADESGVAIRPTMTDHATRPGSVMGTAGYMSPEQASGHAADHRSDQFSFGVVLYEMLTGRLAFDFPTPVERLSAVIREEPLPLGQLAPSVPAPVRWIVERCLAKAPAERYASTRDLARDLMTARDRLSELTTGSSAGIKPLASRRMREGLAWCAAALFAITAAVLVLRPLSSTDAVPAHIVRFTVVPPEGTTFSSVIGASPFAVSPDGQRLAFTVSGPGRRRQLFIRSFDSLDAQLVPGTDGAAHPFWSPDGRSVAFFADSRLKRVALSGGDVAIICEARGGGGGTWNRDGTIVFTPSIDSPLFRVSASGGTPAAATELDAAQGDSGHMAPVFLPDGRRFLFTLVGGRMGVFAGTLDSREIRRVTTVDAIPGFVAPDLLLLVLPDGRLSAQRLDMTRLEPIGDVIPIAEHVETPGPNAAFSASATGTLVYWAGSDALTQPTWFTRDGKAVGTLGVPAAYVDVAISPNGRQVAVDRVTEDPSIWLLDVARGTATRETSGQGKYVSTPIWAPDGLSIAYAMAEGTPPNIFVERIGVGTEGHRLVRSIYQSFPQAWSPDGASIVYATVDPKTGSDLWLVSTRGEPTPVPLLRTASYEDRARISPDGKWMAYMSNESGAYDVFVTRFPKVGQAWPVSIAGGRLPVWRRDGRELFYVAPDGTLMAVPIAPKGDELDIGAPVKLFSVNINAGPGLGTTYDVAPDGRFLVNVAVRLTSPPATVVMNWPQTLARSEP